MGADSQKLCDIIPLLHTLWIAPIQTVVATYLLYNLLGNAAFAGLATIIVLICVTFVLTRQLKLLQINQMKAKDARLKIVSEIIQNLKVNFLAIIIVPLF